MVGTHDDLTLDLNKEAYDQIKAKKKLVIVPKATHLFKKPGTPKKVGHGFSVVQTPLETITYDDCS